MQYYFIECVNDYLQVYNLELRHNRRSVIALYQGDGGMQYTWI